VIQQTSGSIHPASDTSLFYAHQICCRSAQLLQKRWNNGHKGRLAHQVLFCPPCRLLEVDLAAALLHLAPYLQQQQQQPAAAALPTSKAAAVSNLTAEATPHQQVCCFNILTYIQV